MAENCHDESQMKFNELLQVWDLNYKLLRGERESDSKYALRSTQFISCVFGCALVTDLDSAMIAALMSLQGPLISYSKKLQQCS